MKTNKPDVDPVLGERSSNPNQYEKQVDAFNQRQRWNIRWWIWVNSTVKLLSFILIVLTITVTKSHYGFLVPIVLIAVGYLWAYSDRKKRGD